MDKASCDKVGEEWRPVPNTSVAVSNFGRVKSKSGRMMLGGFSSFYKKVNIMVGGKAQLCPVHRLVASAFLPNPL